MPLILGTNSIKDTGYDVANSLRLDEPSNQGLTKTPSGAGNRKTFTLSIWVKRTKITNQTGDVQTMFESRASNNDNCALTFQTDDTLSIKLKVSGTNKSLITNRVFRDVSAWFHLVCAVDTTQSTDSNRVKIYVNGVQETSFGTENYPSQDAQTSFNNSVGHGIGKRSDTTSQNFDGYLTEVVMIDGSALAPTDFGEFNSDSPTIWQPIDVSGLTFGTNGFYLDFEDSSALGNDVSGNNNDYSVSNLSATDQSTDTCTNNFATLNPLAFENAADSLSEGNLRFDGASSGAHNLGIGTIAVDKGKWWFEAELDAVGGTYPQIGLRSVDVNNTLGSYVGEITGGVGYFSAGGSQIDGSTAVASGGYATYTSGDIINVGLDLDNNKIYWYKNGTLVNSGGTTITNRLYTFAVSQYSNTGHWFCNFGAGTIYSISSGNADENGFGNFEHAPPSGYFSLCTKNLAEFG
jgi:hypothetical protein